MSAPASELENEIKSAMGSNNPNDIVSGVKNAVARELSEFSVGARVEFTEYFNHTYMPDLVLAWGEGKRQETRPVFIRNALYPGPTLGDVQNLGSRSPVVLGLSRPSNETDELSEVRATARKSGRVLVTNVGTIDRFAGSQSKRQGSERIPVVTSPLVQLVRENLLRSGRGLLTDSSADRITSAANVVANGVDEASFEGGLSEFSDIASDLFAEDGVTQLTRAGRLLQAAASDRSILAFLQSATGSLSDSEIRVVLPYLLSVENNVDNTMFWSAVGSMLSLEVLESIREIDGLDISRMMTPTTLGVWQAKRSELVLNAEFDPEPDSVAGADFDPEQTYNFATNWTISGGMLSALVGPWKLQFSSIDKRRLPGRADSLDANWSDLAVITGRFALDAATLRGVTRRFEVSVEESGNVAADVQRVTETLEDTYRVQAMVVRVPGSESSIAIDLDFKKMLATAIGGRATLADLGTAALRLLGHKYPVDPDWAVL